MIRCVRIKLHDGEVYYLSPKQGDVLKKIFDGNNEQVVVGGSKMIRGTDVEDINENYFLCDEDIPGYLENQVEREGIKEEIFLSPSERRMRKLPSEYILMTMDWRPLTKEYTMPIDGEYMKKGEKFTAMMSSNHEEPEGYNEWYMVNAHYEIRDGRKEYYLKPEQLKEVFFMKRDKENPGFPYMTDVKMVYGDVRIIREKK